MLTPYFAKVYAGPPFELFGTGHLILLGIIVLFNLSFIFLRRNQSETFRRNMRYGMAITSILVELSWHVWKLWIGEWTVQTMLPLHLCSIFVILNSIMLFTRNYRLFEYSYFLGIAGSMQAMLTPDAGAYGLPHFRAFQTIIAHGLLFSEGVYMAVVEGFRPMWASMRRVLIGANIYMVFIGLLNWAIGSNYLFIAHKPETTSLIDVLGPWPWYIFSLEIIGVVACLLLYLPFAIKDWSASRAPVSAG